MNIEELIERLEDAGSRPTGIGLFNQAAQALREQQAEIERLRKGLSAVEALIGDSLGVYGLHQNGDPAPWSELRTGGRFEPWLVDFDMALDEQA